MDLKKTEKKQAPSCLVTALTGNWNKNSKLHIEREEKADFAAFLRFQPIFNWFYSIWGENKLFFGQNYEPFESYWRE